MSEVRIEIKASADRGYLDVSVDGRFAYKSSLDPRIEKARLEALVKALDLENTEVVHK